MRAQVMHQAEQIEELYDQVRPGLPDDSAPVQRTLGAGVQKGALAHASGVSDGLKLP